MTDPRKPIWPLAIGLVIGGAAVLAFALALWPRPNPTAAAPPGEGLRPADDLSNRGGPGHVPAAESPGQAEAPASSAASAPLAPNGGGVAAPGEQAMPRMRLLVPAYFYPSGPNLDLWERLIRGGERAPIVVVANPGSGPGGEVDPNYQAIIRRAAGHGVTVVGYVTTNYAKRDRGEVEADIGRWVRFYPEIRGFFFDQQASDAEQAAYYEALGDYARERIRGALVLTNPGTMCAEAYFASPALDAACVFEWPKDFERFRLPAWADRYPSGRFAALPYRVEGEERMRECIRLAARGRIGLIFVTDGDGPEPWGRLPRYWEAEVDAVRRVNQRQDP